MDHSGPGWAWLEGAGVHGSGTLAESWLTRVIPVQLAARGQVPPMEVSWQVGVGEIFCLL